MSVELEKVLLKEEYEGLHVDAFSPRQRELLLQCFMRAFRLGEHVCADIEKIKYDGRLVILEDGSRWEVDDMDTSTVSMWDAGDKVVVVDGKMYKLDDLEAAEVVQDDD
jgi:hypothetical protein